MLVTVIIPCYNSEKWIGQCVDSVLKQTYTKLEIIIVDDGSTDNTATVISTFSDPRINYYYKENQGLSATRNFGIARAKGDLIAFLDSDDFWVADKIEKQADKAKTYDFIYCDYSLISEDGEQLLTQSIVNPSLYKEDLKTVILQKNIISGGSAVLIKKNVLEKIGLFNEQLKVGEDWQYWARVLWGGFSTYYIDEKLVVIRTHNASMQKSTNPVLWKTSVSDILHSYLGFNNLKKTHKALIYKRLAINSYRFNDSLNQIFKYYLLSLSNDISLAFDKVLLAQFLKYTVRKIIRRIRKGKNV